MAEVRLNTGARLARFMMLFTLFIIAASVGGQQNMLVALSPILVLVMVLGAFVVMFRPGAWMSLSKGRKVGSIKYLGHYHDLTGAIGESIISALAVGQIVRSQVGPLSAEEYLVVFVAIAASFLVPNVLRVPVTEVIGALAALYLTYEVITIPGGEALAGKALFGLAVLIAGLALLISWNLPDGPVTMFKKGPKPRLLAFFALLELAATMAFPLDHAEAGSAVAVDIWQPSGGGEIIGLGTAIALFTVLSVLTAFGPRLMVGMLGLALAFLELYFLSWYAVIDGAALLVPAFVWIDAGLSDPPLPIARKAVTDYGGADRQRPTTRAAATSRRNGRRDP